MQGSCEGYSEGANDGFRGLGFSHVGSEVLSADYAWVKRHAVHWLQGFLRDKLGLGAGFGSGFSGVRLLGFGHWGFIWDCVVPLTPPVAAAILPKRNRSNIHG